MLIKRIDRFGLLFALVLAMILPECAVSPLSTAGGSSGTEVSRITGRVVYLNGAPAANASVTLRPADFLADSLASLAYTGGHSILDTITDGNGVFVFTKVLPGSYRIEISNPDSFAALVELESNAKLPVISLPADTLRPSSVISGTIRLDGDGTRGIVQVFGMQRLVYADTSGAFSMKMPWGKHHLLIGAYAPDSGTMKVVDAMDVSVQVSPGEEKNIGSFYMHKPPPSVCMDGACDSMVVRTVLDAVGQSGKDIGSVSVVREGRIVGLSLRGLPINTYKIPFDIVRLVKVTSLDFGRTGISMVFPGLTKMRNLEDVRLDSNRLASLPFDIGNLAAVKELDLSGNGLTSLPLSMAQLRPVSLLDLSYNRLRNLDAKIAGWADRYDPDWRNTQRP